MYILYCKFEVVLVTCGTHAIVVVRSFVGWDHCCCSSCCWSVVYHVCCWCHAVSYTQTSSILAHWFVPYDHAVLSSSRLEKTRHALAFSAMTLPTNGVGMAQPGNFREFVLLCVRLFAAVSRVLFVGMMVLAHAKNRKPEHTLPRRATEEAFACVCVYVYVCVYVCMYVWCTARLVAFRPCSRSLFACHGCGLSSVEA